MSEGAFIVALAGRQWSLPHLSFRAIKTIQPLLFEVYAEAGGAAMSAETVARLSEAQLERLARAVWRAVAFVDSSLTYEAFLDLPFSIGDLMQAFPAVARASGLRDGAREDASSPTSPAAPEASRELGKSTSTL